MEIKIAELINESLPHQRAFYLFFFKKFREQEYPEIKLINENFVINQNCGYHLVGNIVFPESAWWNEYYCPLDEKIASMMTTFRQEKNVLNLLESILYEIDIFRKYSEHYGYAFCVLHK